MRTQTKVAAVAAVALIVSMVAVFFVAQQRESDGPRPVSSPEQASAVVREDSRILGEKGTSGTTFVEFLDFECEACGAAFPVVEELREKYAGEVTFVVRYFPLPGHFNAERAARAVEAAARQGEFEALYTKMYETQSSWGEAQEPHDDLFRGFAEDLGLDMAKFDADYASKEVADRVQRDVDDGLALGVQGTPTFYIDGQPFQPQSIEDFHTALDEAIKK